MTARSKTPSAIVAAVCDRRNRARMCTLFGAHRAQLGAHRAPLQFLDRLPRLLAVLCLVCLAIPHAGAEVIEADVCVFGGTSGGIAAAVQTSRMGKRAVIAEPGKFLGGLTTGGIGATDIGNKAAIGGISREFYGRLAKHYARDSAWRFETRADYFAKRGSGQSQASDLTSTNATMWTFEPHVAEQIFGEMLREAKVPI